MLNNTIKKTGKLFFITVMLLMSAGFVIAILKLVNKYLKILSVLISNMVNLNRNYKNRNPLGPSTAA